MSLTALYVEAKSLQSFIGSTLGFVALVAGALFNAKLNRRRDDRLRMEATRTVAAAVHGEIVPLRTAVAKLAKGVAGRYYSHGMGRHRGEPFDHHFGAMFPLPDPLLFRALSDRLGVLPPAMLLPVVSFYSAYEQVRAFLPLLEATPDRDHSYGLSCPLLSGPSTMTVWIKEGTTNASQEAQARGDHREAA